jgi:23S rRNA (cytosine1962-C5)-methyltransferase
MRRQQINNCEIIRPTMSLANLYLRRRQERRVQRGHPWVYSNEVAIDRSPLTAFEPGDCVNVFSHSGKPLGTAYVNPHSLICARMLSTETDCALDDALLTARTSDALALRDALGWRPYCRLVYAESDRLPGLIVDGYGDVLVVQIGTAGMERVRHRIVTTLIELCRPSAVVLRNDLASRKLEGLDTYVEVAHGDCPPIVRLRENGAEFEISPMEGQKTGWYYDHRCNRALLSRHAQGRSVLDCFSYAGGFGIQAARGGARSVLCLDSSESALERVARNADLNAVAGTVAVQRGDVFDGLRALRNEARRFDIVVVDPPAFMRRRKDRRSGLEAYRRLNRRAMQVVADGGLLLTASCSFHLSPEEHQSMVAAAAEDVGRWIQILARGHQAADHPVHPGLPESEYLKAVLVRVTGKT